ncbi:MAG: aminodeoxychorismate/anthranilate synthase component II, partial [Campylobacterota bacterium]|nr:aminodeoxychorismate/anthranilate synthase component II [Campylobacterota bacterium]
NYDSFTYNIVQYCRELGADLKIIRNDEMSVEEIQKLNPQKIIISPGPASPDEAGVTLSTIKHFADKLPILGICLGHQSIAQVFGGDVVRAKNMMHGKTSTMKQVSTCVIFKELPLEFTATRYHSLIVDKSTLPEEIEATAVSTDDDEIMALKIKDRDIYGVQFHPESIMSEYGHEIIGNFLKL